VVQIGDKTLTRKEFEWEVFTICLERAKEQLRAGGQLAANHYPFEWPAPPGAHVPRFWETLLLLAVTPERQVEFLGCFEERFHAWTKHCGPRAARLFYAWHVLRSIWDMVAVRIRSLSDRDR